MTGPFWTAERNKNVEQFTLLFIVDMWSVPTDGVKSVRRFELRIAEGDSFTDGAVDRTSFIHSVFRNSASLLTAEERSDLVHLLYIGAGTDQLVVPFREIRLEYQSMVEDLVFVSHTALNVTTVPLENMQMVNFR